MIDYYNIEHANIILKPSKQSDESWNNYRRRLKLWREHNYQEYIKQLSERYQKIPIEYIDRICKNYGRYNDNFYSCYAISDTLNIFNELLNMGQIFQPIP